MTPAVVALTFALSIIGAMWGEPHILTLDGLLYTFNGLGEYWMIKSSAGLLFQVNI